MSHTFFFYDLETSGLSGRSDRIMQFAGQRTDEALQPIGEPYDILVKLNDDTLPSPDAIMVTGITPQQTVTDGLTEAEFAALLSKEIFTPGTTVVGFNNVRFDDEFIRHLLWRNFYDPYEWAWSEGRSRWDILDVVRMTRALRPEGIEWPVDAEGRATNRLELLTAANGIQHANAHDALADVEALIAITTLIRDRQPKLFDHLKTMRDKKAVRQLVNLDEKRPFVYVSGRYDSEFNKATVAFPLAPAPNSNVLVYDLRYDPRQLIELTEQQLRTKIFASREERRAKDFIALPVKPLQYNRCPAVAPMGVLAQDDGWNKIGLDLETIEAHMKQLLSRPDFAEKLRTIYESKREFAPSHDAEAQLYDGFVSDHDKIRIEAIRNADANALADFTPEFRDERLPPLLLRYKARSFPVSLSEPEQAAWERWRSERITKQLPAYLASLQRLASTADDSQRFLLEELQLWAEAIVPSDYDA